MYNLNQMQPQFVTQKFDKRHNNLDLRKAVNWSRSRRKIVYKVIKRSLITNILKTVYDA